MAVVFGDMWAGGDSSNRIELRQMVRDTVAFEEAVNFLAARERSADVPIALQTLAHDGNLENRMIAAAILSRFPTTPAAWDAVIGALTDSDARLSGAADQSLGAMLRHPSATVDFRTVRPELRALVAGTFPSAMRNVLEVMRKLGTVDDAQYAVAQNGHLVLAMLESTRVEYRQAAHRFLVAANDGQDLGIHAADWQAWIDELPAPDV